MGRARTRVTVRESYRRASSDTGSGSRRRSPSYRAGPRADGIDRSARLIRRYFRLRENNASAAIATTAASPISTNAAVLKPPVTATGA